MTSFNATRRSLLRASTLGTAATAFPLAAFTEQARSTTSSSSSPQFFDVRTFGATGDGKTLDTPAVNRTIDAAVSAGGGTVLFPAGSYLCFSIHLRSNVHLYLSQGSALVAADSPLPSEQSGYRSGRYDAAEPDTAWDAYQDYGHNHWHNSLLWGEDIHDFGISGPGLIWGKGLSNGRDAKDGGTRFVAEQAGVGNKAIALKNCRNVVFRDFSILKGGHFGLLLTGVDNATIDNLKIDTDRDGIDLDCCQNVRVSNCTVNSPWDDGICPKSSYALGYPRVTKNVTISNCWVTGDYQLGSVLDGTFKNFPEGALAWRTGRIKCGTESNGGFINIAISNCIFEGCQGYALESVDGALMEDITISNTVMRDLASGPIFMRLGARLRGPRETTKVGTLKRIIIDNLTCHNAPQSVASILSGIPDYPIEDIKLSNIYIECVGGAKPEIAGLHPAELERSYPDPNMFGTTPSYGFYLRHIRGIEMSHVELATVNVDSRPAFHLTEVDRADFFAVTAPRGDEGAFALHNVKDLRIGWSRAAADTHLNSVDNKTV